MLHPCVHLPKHRAAAAHSLPKSHAPMPLAGSNHIASDYFGNSLRDGHNEVCRLAFSFDVLAAKDEMFDLIFFASRIFQLVAENSPKCQCPRAIRKRKAHCSKSLFAKAETVGVAIFHSVWYFKINLLRIYIFCASLIYIDETEAILETLLSSSFIIFLQNKNGKNVWRILTC
jgi:hypothetical protein